MEGGNDLELLRQQVGDHQRILEDHEQRLLALTEGQRIMKDEQDDTQRKLEMMERNQLELKTIIYAENRETRETMRGTTEKLFHLIEQMTGSKTAATTLEYDYRKAELEANDKKSARFWEWFGKIAGAGGILAIAVTAIVQFLQQ